MKGWLGEAQGAFAQLVFLDSAIYTSLNNVTLQTSNGTTQIDHVVVSRYGIFVIETKNIEGWVYGDEKSSQWTIVRPGRKYKMQNPLHQNYRHVRAIIEFLGIEESKIHSVVMFWGRSSFKTQMPANVMDKGYITYIKSFTNVVFQDSELQSVVEALRIRALPSSRATRKLHIESLGQRHSSNTICPKCGSALIVRVAKSGANAGRQFYACSAFPKCRYTKAFITCT